MLDTILIPESELAAHDDEVKAKANSIEEAVSVDLDNEVYGVAFGRYLLLSHWPELVEGTETIAEKTLLYNRYYWFMRFVRAYCAQHGPDAGLEQQAFQMLEQSMTDIDWQVVEAIENRIKSELGQ